MPAARIRECLNYEPTRDQNAMTFGGDLHALVDQAFTTSDFRLANGQTLLDLRIAYETDGTRAPGRANSVLLTRHDVSDFGPSLQTAKASPTFAT